MRYTQVVNWLDRLKLPRAPVFLVIGLWPDDHSKVKAAAAIMALTGQREFPVSALSRSEAFVPVPVSATAPRQSYTQRLAARIVKPRYPVHYQCTSDPDHILSLLDLHQNKAEHTVVVFTGQDLTEATALIRVVEACDGVTHFLNNA